MTGLNYGFVFSKGNFYVSLLLFDIHVRFISAKEIAVGLNPRLGTNTTPDNKTSKWKSIANVPNYIPNFTNLNPFQC